MSWSAAGSAASGNPSGRRMSAPKAPSPLIALRPRYPAASTGRPAARRSRWASTHAPSPDAADDPGGTHQRCRRGNRAPALGRPLGGIEVSPQLGDGTCWGAAAEVAELASLRAIALAITKAGPVMMFWLP